MNNDIEDQIILFHQIKSKNLKNNIKKKLLKINKKDLINNYIHLLSKLETESILKSKYYSILKKNKLI